MNVFLNSWDLNGVVHETVSLRGKGTGTCLLWDGYSYGDRDGLLSDDLSSAMGLQINKSLLCQAMARGGMHTLFSPEVVAEAWDCAVTPTAPRAASSAGDSRSRRCAPGPDADGGRIAPRRKDPGATGSGIRPRGSGLYRATENSGRDSALGVGRTERLFGLSADRLRNA